MQANAVEMGGPEQDKAAELKFPYSTRKRVVVFGGHDSWRKAIRRFFPMSPLSTVSRDPTRI